MYRGNQALSNQYASALHDDEEEFYDDGYYTEEDPSMEEALMM